MGNAQSNHDAAKVMTDIGAGFGQGLNAGVGALAPWLKPVTDPLTKGWSDSREYVHSIDKDKNPLAGKEEYVENFRNKTKNNPFAIYDGQEISKGSATVAQDPKFQEMVGNLSKQMFSSE